MTDRELLELAAKAAGIVIHHWSDGRLPHECPVLNDGINEYIRVFDPITDDGDALRLAVKLGLDVCIDTSHEREPHTHVIGFCTATSSETVDAIEGHGDPYAATRRAITRAAAEIGKVMK